jgi:6-phosphogluconolactonase (cycloisomerase 2 family)
MQLEMFSMTTLMKGLDARHSHIAWTAVVATSVLMSTAASAERTLYVANADGNVATFAIDKSDGTLRLTDVVSGVGTTLRGITVAPNGRSAYVSNSDASTLIAFGIDEHGLPKQIGDPVETDPNAKGPFPDCAEDVGATTSGPCPFGMAIAPDGRSLYVSNASSNSISVFSVQPDGSARRDGVIDAGGASPRGVAVSPDGRRLYVALGDSDSIAVFGVEPNRMPTFRESVHVPGCTPSAARTLAGQCFPMWMSITPDGHWLYTANMASGDVSTFAIQADGGLRAIGSRIPTGGRPEGIAITPDMRFLYVNVEDENAVKTFAIGANGELSLLASATTCDEAITPAACGAVFTLLAPDSRTLYTANTFRPFNTNNVLTFRRESSGALTQLAAIPTGGNRPLFQGLAMRPNQGPVASLAPASGVVNEPTAFDAAMSSDSDGDVRRYDWDFGDGRVAADAGPRPTHTYVGPGRYRVTVTVTDNEGCSGQWVFTGQTASCNGSSRASASRSVRVGGRAQ